MPPIQQSSRSQAGSRWRWLCVRSMEEQDSPDYGLAELVGDRVASDRQPDHLARSDFQFGRIPRRQETAGRFIPRAGLLPDTDIAAPFHPAPATISPPVP